jgi:hypothetical protein
MRNGPKVTRVRHRSLPEALDTLRRQAAELELGTPVAPAGTAFLRRYDPVSRVVGRVEVSGPRRLRGGLDVRGDGSTEAFRGRLRRRLIEQRDGESACDALARVLEEDASR